MRSADTWHMALHEMQRWSGPAGGAYIIECTCGWTEWTKADTPETSIESTFERHVYGLDQGAQRDGSDMRDGPFLPAPSLVVGLAEYISEIAPVTDTVLAMAVMRKLWEMGVEFPNTALIDGPLRCENCGKTMAEHDRLAHCWPAHRDGGDNA